MYVYCINNLKQQTVEFRCSCRCLETSFFKPQLIVGQCMLLNVHPLCSRFSVVQACINALYVHQCPT